MKILYRYIIAVSFCALTFSGFAQDRKMNTLSIEGFGHSLNIYSLNYDRIFLAKKNFWLNNNIGVSYRPNRDSPGINKSVSNTINCTIGPKISHIECGIGLGFLRNEERGPDMDRAVVLARLGYKYQRPQGGFFMRLGVTPNFMFYDRPKCTGWCGLDLALHFLGASIGYTF